MSGKRGRPRSAEPGVLIGVRVPEDAHEWILAMSRAEAIPPATIARSVLVRAIRERQAAQAAPVVPAATGT